MPISLDIRALRNELEILHLIVHRNKNQHRQAKWWKYVSIIHRTVKKLVAVPQQEGQPHGAGPKKDVVRISQKDRQMRRGTERKKVDREAETENVPTTKPRKIVFRRTEQSKATGLVKLDMSLRDFEPIRFSHVERAEYLVYRVIPKAFNAFHRLVAHGQYVTLGLVLLATVARIWHILRQDTRVFKPSGRSLPITDNAVTVDEADDLGHVVKRREDEVGDMIAEFQKIRDDDVDMILDGYEDGSVDDGIQVYDENVSEDESPIEESSNISPSKTDNVERRRSEVVDDDLVSLKFFG
ncbi:hypothetical protein V1517DRAFT_319938 [Lipomyces orientalis]|uniref:Uncharacterized protein n=1 Tax=Lipomyces orientalis TaxID=1233043 RepID=A0ACC3TR15_9ASCO